ncbi:MAG: hypothetical protein LBD74_05060, partial [Spirochaetaceae bacterium]|nr:hypothetical protein [Spirochaetaceae bacterium]
MIQVLFFLRFRTQLRRTRPQLILQLEKAIVEALEGAGAIVEHKHRIITGYFNKQALGIWLTIITFLEEITALLGEADSELYGYSLVVSEDLEDYVQGWIGSNLAALSGGSRIWCERSVQPFLSPYVDFDGPAELASPEPPLPAFLTTYVQMKRFGLSSEGISESLQQRSGMKDKMLHILRYGAATNAVLVGPAFMGKRVALYRFCAEALGEIPPMILRFSPRKSLGALADMYSPPVRGLLEGHAVPEVLGELEGLQHVLFQERLMDEYSGYLLVQGRRFFTQLVRAYMTVVQDLERVPILILEDLHLADETMTDLVLDACAGFETLKVYGIYSYDPASEATPLDSLREDLCRWDPLLPKTLHFSKEYYIPLQSPLMSRDLWEVAYAARLLKPYFPGFLFPQLFQEAESTSAMALRAFTILARLGLIDVIEDPAPRFPRFTHLAEAWLGERKDHIRTFVRKRLLGWVLQGLLRPCFGLLEILAALDGQGDDNLVLNAVYGDVITGAYQGIQQAIKANCFETVVGVDKGPQLIYIFTTLKALIHGTEGEIHEAFTRPAPLEVLFSGYQIHILVNLTAY